MELVNLMYRYVNRFINSNELIKELNVKDNVTIIMVTHDIENAVNYANKILHLGRKKYFYGTVEEYEKSNTSDAFLGGNE